MDWSGVLMIIRPINYDDGCPARLVSARTVQGGGGRNVDVHMPYKDIKHYFRSSDDDHCFVEADCMDGNLRLYNRAVAGLQSWVLHSLTDSQKNGVN